MLISFNGTISIDLYGVQTRDFDILFCRSYEFNFNNLFKAKVKDVNDSRFKYLESQVLIFTPE